MDKFLLLIFLVSFFISNAQQLLILDKDSKLPLKNVSVFFIDKEKKSNSFGELSIEKLKGTDKLIFSLFGYKTVQHTYQELEKHSFKIFMQQIEGLHEVVISNTKWSQTQSVVPKQVVKTTAKQIENTNPQTSADLLQKTGKIFIQKSQLGGGSPMIRGFSTNRLLISVDGVRMNNAIFRSGNLQNIISIDPFTVQNSEVILGPGSVVYGSDAIGGTINFITAEPKFGFSEKAKVKGKAVYRFSSANLEQTAHAQVKFSAKQWASLTSFSFSDFDNLVQGKYGSSDYLRNEYVETNNTTDLVVNNPNPREQVDSGFNQYNFLQKFNVQLNSDLKVGFDLVYNETSNYNRYDQLQRTDDNGDFRFAEWFYGPQKWLKASNKIDFDENKLLFNSIRITNTYQFFEESRHNRDLNSLFRDINIEKLYAYNFNLDVEKKIKRHSVYYGLEYVYNKVNSSASIFDIATNTHENSIYTRYPNNSTWQSMAAYLVTNTKLNNKFSFTSGIRYNHIILQANFTDGDLDFPFTEANLNTGALTGSLGFTYSISNHFLFKGNIGTAFRAPNIDDIGKITQDSQPGTLIVPNPNLRPEYAYNSDFSFSYFSDKVQFSVAGFYTFLENAITTDNFSLVGGISTIEFRGEESEIFARQNTEELFTYGLELSTQIKLMDCFKLTGSYALTKGQENQSDGDKVPVRHVAPAFGSFHLIYEKTKWHADAYLDFNGGFSYNELAPSEQSKTYIYALNSEGNPYLPSWYTLNIRGSYNLSNKIKIVSGVENITNQRYRAYSSGISSAGVNFVTSLKYAF